MFAWDKNGLNYINMKLCWSKMEYRREIDGLRAIAVLPVILFHAGFETFGGGFVGVDIFFVISGFLITTIISEESKTGRFSIVNFYERRARRIFPALFLVMGICIISAWFLFLPGDMKEFADSITAVSLFLSNFLFWYQSGYFDTVAEMKPMLHTWSLAVEEQFYVIFPLLFMLFMKLGKQYVLTVLSILFFASLGFAQWVSITNPEMAFYFLPARGWELLLGSLISLFLYRVKIRNRIANECGTGLGLLLILYSIFFYSKITPFPGVYALAPTIGAGLIIVFATQKTMLGQIIGNKLFMRIGAISYSAYLWHQPLFVFARYMTLNEPSKAMFATLSVVTFALAYLSWKFVELPFRDKYTVNKRVIFSGSFLFLSIFIVFGIWGRMTDGFSNRVDRSFGGDIGHLLFHQYIDENYFDCEPKVIAEQALSWNGFLRCKQSKEGVPDVVLLGDSHAEHLFIGLAEVKSNSNVAFYIKSDKPYIENPEFATIFNELISNKKHQKVILTMNYMGRLKWDVEGLYDGFSGTIKALLNAGKEVYILGDIPKYNKDAQICAYAKNSVEAVSYCYLYVDSVEYQRDMYGAVLTKLSKDYHVPYIDIYSPLCTETKCGMIKNNNVLYRDDNHLNILGSELIGRYVAEKLDL